jgi:hypothetical protein
MEAKTDKRCRRQRRHTLHRVYPEIGWNQSVQVRIFCIFVRPPEEEDELRRLDRVSLTTLHLEVD